MAEVTELRQELWRRQLIASVTFGVELRGVAVMLESDWHRTAASIDRRRGTCDPLLDEFWMTCFSPMTTRWIHDHPLLHEVEAAFDRYRLVMRGHFDFESPRWRDLCVRPF